MAEEEAKMSEQHTEKKEAAREVGEKGVQDAKKSVLKQFQAPIQPRTTLTGPKLKSEAVYTHDGCF